MQTHHEPHKPQITIHIGASHDEVVVDGYRFDRSKMKGPEKGRLRGIVRDCLTELSRKGLWGAQRQHMQGVAA